MSAKYFPWLGIVLVLLCLHNGRTQIPTYDVRLANLLHMQQGIGWPLHLYVAEGHEALMKLSERLENQQTCEVTTPGGITFNVHNPSGKRYEPWSDGCGVRVKNVVPLDVGRWRMTATRGNTSITGWSELHVTGRNCNNAIPIVLEEEDKNVEDPTPYAHLYLQKTLSLLLHSLPLI